MIATDFPSVEKLFPFMKQKAISTDTYSSSDRTFGMVDTQTLGDSLTESSESRLGTGRGEYIYSYDRLQIFTHST